MNKSYFSTKGKQLQLGRVVGKGGEAVIHEVNGYVDYVAKIYHKPLDKEKQEKLSFMVAIANNEIMRYSAWPISTLTEPTTNMIVGFVMRRVVNKKALHDVYSPAHRRQEHPELAWDYLLYVARNIASAFDSIHKQGYVIGDVNENSIMAGIDSQVSIIDTDSFQIAHAEGVFLCEVGVASFTPPELQSQASFVKIQRTQNHDNFGLALLIFHVLFGGRHPFAGKPLSDSVGNAIEQDIQSFRYAYAPDAQKRGFEPPPRSIPISILPQHIQDMFFSAFTEQGAKKSRPGAQQWVAVLDDFRTKLNKCKTIKTHVYSGHLPHCPWCALEQQGVVYFVDVGGNFASSANGFILVKVWAEITKISPPNLSLQQPIKYKTIATPLPSNIQKYGLNFAWLFLILGVVLIFTVRSAQGWGWIMSLISVFVIYGGGGTTQAFEQEKERRKLALKSAKQTHNDIKSKITTFVQNNLFSNEVQRLNGLRTEYEAMANREKREIQHLSVTAEERQKQKFLSTCFINNSDIHGIGSSFKASLRSFGIETASDVSKQKVRQVRGFGDVRTRAMLDWKASCERRFKFNLSIAVSQQDINAVRVKIMQEKSRIESELISAPRQLQRLKMKVLAEHSYLSNLLEDTEKKLAQAQADYDNL